MAGDDIERIIHMRTLHLGPEELLVAAKVGCAVGGQRERRGDRDRRRREAHPPAVPIARVIYIEPDIYRDPAATAR